jgi:hypothetical protein
VEITTQQENGSQNLARISRRGGRRPDFRPHGVRLACIAKDIRAFRFENSESYLRISRVALRCRVFWEAIDKIENEVVATERDIFRRG